MSVDQFIQSYWNSLGREDIYNLVSTIQTEFENNPAIKDALAACDMTPSPKTKWLAAAAAVHVLFSFQRGNDSAQ